MATVSQAPAFEIRVSLLHVRPEVWRTIRVPADIRMDRLHGVLQEVLGWTDSHMHQFHVIDAKGGTKAYVGRPDGEFERDTRTQDETKRLLKNFLTKPGDRIGYEYDFGDGWLHEIKLEAVSPQTARLTRDYASMAPGRVHPRTAAVRRDLRACWRRRPIPSPPMQKCAIGWATTTPRPLISPLSTGCLAGFGCEWPGQERGHR